MLGEPHDPGHTRRPTHTTSGPVGCAARNRSTRSAALPPRATSRELYASTASIATGSGLRWDPDCLVTARAAGAGPSVAASTLSVLRLRGIRIFGSAYRHGLTGDEIRHTWANAIAFFDIDREHEPVKSLCIGPGHRRQPSGGSVPPVARWRSGHSCHAAASCIPSVAERGVAMSKESGASATPAADDLVEIAAAFENAEFSTNELGAIKKTRRRSPRLGRRQGRGSDLSRSTEPHGPHQAEGHIRRHHRESGDPRRSRRLPVAALRASTLPSPVCPAELLPSWGLCSSPSQATAKLDPQVGPAFSVNQAKSHEHDKCKNIVRAFSGLNSVASHAATQPPQQVD